MPSKAPRSDVTVSPGNSRWIKDDLRAVAELGVVATVGAVAGWFSGLGVFVGAAAAIALFWFAVVVACLLEFF